MNLNEYLIKASKGIKKRFDKKKKENEALYNSFEVKEPEIIKISNIKTCFEDEQDDIVNFEQITRRQKLKKRLNTSSRDRIKPDSNNYENISLLMDFNSRNSKLSTFGVSADSVRPQTGIPNKVRNNERLITQLNNIIKGKVFKYGDESDIMIVDESFHNFNIRQTASKLTKLNHSSEHTFKRPMTTGNSQRYNTISRKEINENSASRNSSQEKQKIPSKRSSRILKLANQKQHGARIGNDGYMKIIRDNDIDSFTPRISNRLPPPPIGQTMRHQQFAIK